MAEGGQSRTPADFLKSIKGKPVIVKLNSGVDYRGEMQHLKAPGFPNRSWQ
jgi:small nuclear ribonucleoprotein (snRNP)-like protein